MTPDIRARPAAETLAAFVTAASWARLPESLRHQGKRTLLNIVVCALEASGDAAVATAAQVMAPFSGSGRTALIGRPERLDPMGASFVNALASNLLDYDDTHFPTAIHPTAPTAAPLLALAELKGASGAEWKL